MERLLNLARRVGAVLAALAFIFAASNVGVKAQGPLTILGLTIPDRVAGLPHAQPYDFEKTNPGLGYSIEFQRPGWRIDVYIYDFRMTSIPDDPMSDVIKNQLAQAKGDVFALEKRGNYADVALKDEYTVSDREGRTRFVCASFNYVHKAMAATVDSYLCLTSWKNKFFKIRMTARQGDTTRAVAAQFVEAWINVLWPL